MPGWKLRFPTEITTALIFAAAAILIPRAQAALASTPTLEQVRSLPTADRSPSNWVKQDKLNQPLLVAQRQGRKALVIGNAAYEEDALANPVNDANDIAEALRSLGFEVTLRTNLDLRAMDEAIDAFNRQLRSGEVGLFYYAGHGVQVAGENYLIPLRAKLARQADVKYDAVPLGKILNAMEASETQVNILIIDACRDNPFYRRWRSGHRGSALKRGLASIKIPPTGTIVAFSTSPGNVAEDGEGRRNSPYTFHLLRYLNTPNLDVGIMFRRVRAAVLQETNNEQDPLHQVSLVSEFALNPTQSPSRPTSLIGAAAKPSPDKPATVIFAPAAAGPAPAPPAPAPAPASVVAPAPDPRFNGSQSLISSTTGVNYQKLNALLAAQRWKEADTETRRAMVQASGIQDIDWLPSANINIFACEDLRLIDRLWIQHSNGRFGFSVQKDIYINIGGELDGKFHREIWQKFADRVKWHEGSYYKHYSNLIFDLTAAPGHLPSLGWIGINLLEPSDPLPVSKTSEPWVAASFVRRSRWNLFARTEVCDR